MWIAVPSSQGRVAPVFDTASRLLMVCLQRGREVERKEYVLGALASDALVRNVTELRVNALLCAAISEPLRLALERGGVRVEPNLCGEVEALLAAFCNGNWRHSKFRMPGSGEERRPGTLRRRRSRGRISAARRGKAPTR